MVDSSLISFTKTDFGSLSENVPRLKLSNLYLIKNPISLSGESYVARPSLSLFGSIPSNSIRGIFAQESNGKENIYVISETTLYQLNTDGSVSALGFIPGVGFCSFASTIYGIAIVSDGAVFLYQNNAVIPVSLPDALLASTVTSLDNFFIIGARNTSTFYWINPGDTIVDPLNFASAERNPDDIISVKTIGDEMWALGQSTVEVFIDSGDLNAPFTRLPGKVFQIGCADANSVILTNKNVLPCLIWVTANKEVVLSQGLPTKVSNESIEELLKLSLTFTAWSFRANRHDFYVLSTDNETLVYDITVDSWYRWSTYQKETWDAQLGVQVNSVVYAVNNTSGNIFTLSNNPIDPSLDYLVCEIGGFIPNTTNVSMPCSVVTIFANYGNSPSYLTNPLVELRYSDNSTSTWSPYYQGSLGTKGRYDTVVRFRSLGSFRRPGRYIELRFSEISSFRLDGATLNDGI